MKTWRWKRSRKRSSTKCLSSKTNMAPRSSSHARISWFTNINLGWRELLGHHCSPGRIRAQSNRTCCSIPISSQCKCWCRRKPIIEQGLWAKVATMPLSNTWPTLVWYLYRLPICSARIRLESGQPMLPSARCWPLSKRAWWVRLPMGPLRLPP